MNEHVFFFLLLCGSTRHQTQTEKEILLNYRNRLRVPGAFTQKSLQFAHESLSVVDEYLSQSHWPCDVCRLIRYNMQRRQEFSYFNHTRILAHTFWNIYMMIVGGNSFPGLTTKECQNTKWMETKNYNQIKLLHTRCLSGRTLQLFAIDSDTFVLSVIFCTLYTLHNVPSTTWAICTVSLLSKINKYFFVCFASEFDGHCGFGLSEFLPNQYRKFAVVRHTCFSIP